MRKLILLCLIAGVTACTPRNESYYMHHPTALEQAVSACPDKSPGTLSCNQLKILANQMNVYAMQLQMGRQAFGQSILSLQEAIAKEAKTVDKTGRLKRMKRELQLRLAVVRWLESPER